MKIYLSGKISGADYQEVEKKFANAERLIISMGHEPVSPLKNGLKDGDKWIDHIVKDISMLAKCKGIMLLKDWAESNGSKIEKAVAEELMMKVMYEANADKNALISALKNAITKVTGKKHNEYTGRSRTLDVYFARMIFIYHLSKTDLTVEEIGAMSKRDRNSVTRTISRYEDEIKFNPDFRELANKVNEALIK